MITGRVEGSYRRLHPRLWHALVAYTGDSAVADEAETEAFSQAMLQGDNVDDVDAWVWRTAFRTAADLLEDRPDDVPIRSAPEGLQDPSVVAVFSQLDQLSLKQRAVVVLRYLGHFRHNEIAGLLDTTPPTIRVQLHRSHLILNERPSPR